MEWTWAETSSSPATILSVALAFSAHLARLGAESARDQAVTARKEADDNARKFEQAWATISDAVLVTDSEKCIEASLVAARDAGVDYVMFGGMTLKGGRQSDTKLLGGATNVRTKNNET